MDATAWNRLAYTLGLKGRVFEAQVEALEERAAIKEYDGKIQRQDAKEQTLKELFGL